MNQYNQKSIYCIRKYTVGVVSVLATMTFLIGGHDAMASEQHTTQASSELARTEVTVSNQSLSEDTHTQSLPQKEGQHSHSGDSKNPKTSLFANASSQEQLPTTPEQGVSSDNPNTSYPTHINENTNVPSLVDIQQEKGEKSSDVPNSEKVKTQSGSQIEAPPHSNNPKAGRIAENQDLTFQQSDVALKDQSDVEVSKRVNHRSSEAMRARNVEKAQTDEIDQMTSQNLKPVVKDKTDQGKEQAIAEHKDQTKKGASEEGMTQKETTQEQQSQTRVANSKEVLEKSSTQAQQKQSTNKYPIVLVHGFLGLVGENAPALYPNYWGGNKFKVIEALRKKGYDIHQASVGAFSSNYARAVDLYYFIKGGRVDYGAAHAAQYGHERFGKIYKGIMPDWRPGKKVHLIGHSMGGQTVRLMEELLRNGSKDEIAYHQKHGGTISPLFKGGLTDMVSSITTLGTPHNGSQAADQVANKEFVRHIMYALSRVAGSEYSDFDLGLRHWGFKQRPGESYFDYMKRVSESPIWQTKDNAAYDLTLEGSAILNQKTSLNPNITYTTYTAEASHKGASGKEVPNVGVFPLMDLTSRIIGSDARLEWRKNDGVVAVISSLFPLNQPFVKVSSDALATRRGIWQVRPVLKNWDHVDFIGIDIFDLKRTGGELAKFYMSIMDNLLHIEALDMAAHIKKSAS
ncbi:YSIRK-type signal peptide-containing protein [Staphylococcus pseudintermedius]|nr:YSIRK-type signal peptide-containing protein [Staphylococcus pseudintermedius]